jgi:hypothetical protein
MEKFFSWAMRPVNHEDVETWFNINNMIFEKRQLFSDFTFCLFDLISSTYLGDDNDSPSETRLIMNQDEKLSHFDWCWKKTIENFTKENIKFYSKGEHYDHFKSFFDEVYYNQKEQKVKDQIGVFFEDLFDLKKPFTKSDIDMLTDLYKSLDKNLKK